MLLLNLIFTAHTHTYLIHYEALTLLYITITLYNLLMKEFLVLCSHQLGQLEKQESKNRTKNWNGK